MAAAKVGATSTTLAMRVLRWPACRPSCARTIKGTRSVVSKAKEPCVSSPCSPKASPWSETTRMNGGFSPSRSSTPSKRRPSWASVAATSAQYGFPPKSSGANPARRLVGVVRVVHVHPKKKRPTVRGVSFAEPGEGRVDHFTGRAFRSVRRSRSAGRRVAAGRFVELEALVEPEALVQHDRSEKSRRAVAGCLRSFDQRFGGRRKRCHPVVAQSVPRGVEAGEHRSVGWQRDRDTGVGAIEDEALGRERVQVGGGAVGVAVDAECIGTRRIQRQEQHRWARGGRRRATARECQERASDSEREGAHTGREWRRAGEPARNGTGVGSRSVHVSRSEGRTPRGRAW